jgi:hypothetical protein
MDYAVGEKEGNFVAADDARIKDAFKAISAQAYRAYLEHKGG